MYGIKESREAESSDSALGILKKRLEKSQLGSKAGGSGGGASPADDARTCSVLFNASGERYR
eukprot:3449456-Karenia_brevis.AAC.1